MRALSFAALIVGMVLIPTAFGLAKLDHDRQVSQLERTLVAETNEHGGALESYFARARAIVLLTANSPAFGNVLEEPGTRAQKVRRQSRSIARGHAPARLPGAALPGEHRRGVLHRRQRRGVRARRARRDRAAPPTCRPTEEQAPFFAPTFALRVGQAHQTQPYVSPGHQRVGHRQRHADPAGGRPQARVRALRGHDRELPPRDGPQRPVRAARRSTAAPAAS